MKIFATTLFAALLAPTAFGGTVLFAENTNRTRHQVFYEIFVNDDRPGVFEFDVSIADDSPNNADIVALFFSFNHHNAEHGYTPNDFSSDSISCFEFNNRRTQQFSIGRHFDFSLAFASPGSERETRDSFSFTLNVLNGLTLDELMLFGLRGTIAEHGPSHDGHSKQLSAKSFVGYTGRVSTPVAVPMPSAVGLALAGMGFVTGVRRRDGL